MAESGRRELHGAHFTEEDWADFARQQGDAQRNAALERHLHTGCERCAKTLDMWTAVFGMAGQEASYQPPDDVLARMKGQFGVYRPAGLIERAARSVSLIFDSFRQPALAGVRAAGASPRQLLYRAGRFTIRLQVESTVDTDRLSVVGQIVDEADPSTGLPDLPVLLSTGEETLDRTLTNNLGEFQLQADPSEHLRLSVGIPEIGTLALPGFLLDGTERGGATRGTLGGSARRTRARHA